MPSFDAFDIDDDFVDGNVCVSPRKIQSFYPLVKPVLIIPKDKPYECVSEVALALKATRLGKVKFNKPQNFNAITDLFCDLDISNSIKKDDETVVEVKNVEPKKEANDSFCDEYLDMGEIQVQFEPGFTLPERVLRIYEYNMQVEAQRHAEDKLWELRQKREKHMQQFSPQDFTWDMPAIEKRVALELNRAKSPERPPRNVKPVGKSVSSPSDIPQTTEKRKSTPNVPLVENNGNETKLDWKPPSYMELRQSAISTQAQNESVPDSGPDIGLKSASKSSPKEFPVREVEKKVEQISAPLPKNRPETKALIDKLPLPETTELLIPEPVRNGMVMHKTWDRVNKEREWLNEIEMRREKMDMKRLALLEDLELSSSKRINLLSFGKFRENTKFLHDEIVMKISLDQDTRLICMVTIANKILSQVIQTNSTNVVFYTKMATVLSTKCPLFRKIMLATLYQKKYCETIPYLPTNKVYNSQKLREMDALGVFYAKFLLDLHEEFKELWPILFMWGYLSDICNLKIVPEASVVILRNIIKICGGVMRKVYGTQYVKMIKCIKNKFIPEVERVSPPVALANIHLLKKEINEIRL